MKRVFLLIIVCLGITNTTYSQDGTERVYISTDKSSYIAGSKLWCSVFSFFVPSDPSDEISLSNISSIVYIELSSSEGLINTTKATISHGRGEAWIELSPTLPTGYYYLTAYTLGNTFEKDYLPYRRIITLFNTLSGERLAGSNVKLEEHHIEESSNLSISLDNNIIKRGEVFDVTLVNLSETSLNVSLSIYHEDPQEGYYNIGIEEYLSSIQQEQRREDKNSFTEEIPSEPEGEIFRVALNCDDSTFAILRGRRVSLSRIGEINLYFSTIEDDKTISFILNSISDKADFVIEPDLSDLSSDIVNNLKYEFLPISPYYGYKFETLPVLIADKSKEDILKQKSINMQIERYYHSDSLLMSSDKQGLSYPFVSDEPDIVYSLNDYAKFNTMREVLREVAKDINVSISRRDGITLKLLVEKEFRKKTLSHNKPLLLIDGAVINDHNEILGFNVDIIKEIALYNNSYFHNGVFMDGIISITTNTGDIRDVRLNSHTRIVTYPGVSSGVRPDFGLINKNNNYPDCRDTIEWIPDEKIDAGNTLTLSVKTPPYRGKFAIRVEGVDNSGNAVYQQTSFIVE